uniref:Uncharacterized protein n=1 Tax=Avena sativa TaxID=4498 RepID=A0ACD5W2B2_AVESA
MGVARCLKILALLSLVPLALRAGSLLGHVAAPQPPSSSQYAAVTSASAFDSAHAEAGHHQGRRRRTSEGAALPATARFRPGLGGNGGFADDKRMAPSGSNPLHNLR